VHIIVSEICDQLYIIGAGLGVPLPETEKILKYEVENGNISPDLLVLFILDVLTSL
jgi:hypothetical protein